MQLLNEQLSREQFGELCFDFGIELDEVTSEYEKVCKEMGEEKAIELNSDKEPLYKIEVPANRYDLLCPEGLSRALRIFTNKETMPQYRTITPDTPLVMTVKASVCSHKLQHAHLTKINSNRNF